MALPPQNPNPRELWVDHETGIIHRAGNDPVELVGPTSGIEYEQLKAREKENAERMAVLKRQMLSWFECTQCHQKFLGTMARVTWRKVEGADAETLVCKDPKCDGPVIVIKDAREALNELVVAAILTAREFPSPQAWMYVSCIEEQLAEIIPAQEAEGEGARRAAILAARKAGDKERVELLTERYAKEGHA